MDSYIHIHVQSFLYIRAYSIVTTRIFLFSKPDIIVANPCAASLLDFGRLIMDDQDLASLYDTCPDATLIASHMDTVAHATLTRKTLREKLAGKGILESFLIPADGEFLRF